MAYWPDGTWFEEGNPCLTICRYKNGSRRFESRASTSTSWGWARFLFDLTGSVNEPIAQHLLVGLGKSKVLWNSWCIFPAKLRVESYDEWGIQMAFELRKRQTNGEVPKLLDSFQDPFFQKEAPAVGLSCFTNSFPDGEHRETGLLLVWRSPEGLTVKLTDNELGQSWQYTAETFLKALHLVEKALQAGLAGNRSMKSRPGKHGKK